MNKKILSTIIISIPIATGVLFVIWIGYVLFMNIFYPMQGTAIQKAYLETYAGCGKSGYLLEISDGAFTEAWQTASTTFEISPQDVDREIAGCRKQIEKNGGAILWSYDESGKPVYLDADTMKKIKAYQEKFLKREFSALKK
ncbi:MAG: hypothetical protein E6R05_05885 [Candidatus Moraniibacteriota bacterium]|nr:MAG: hypothetical protein E6R05_05885 [Candidatus Moranbacteria bacterium]